MEYKIDPTLETPEQLKKALYHLGERVKELTALHTTARLFQEEHLSTEALLENIVALLPPSWQYPEITAGRICFDGLIIATPNFRESPWVQKARFTCQGERTGSIEVAYLEEQPQEVEGPFLAEERHLINSLAEMLKIHLDRKLSNEELGKLSKVYRDAPVPIIIEDLHGIIIDVNPEAERVYGWTAQELIGQSIMTLIPSEGQALAHELRTQCQDGQPIRNISSYRQRKSGTVMPVLVSLSLLTEEDGQAIGLVSFTKDISELKRAESALKDAQHQLEERVPVRTAELSQANESLRQEIIQRKEAEQQLEATQEKIQRSHDDLQAIMIQLHIGMALINREGRISFLSRGMQELSHRRPERYIGRPWEELFEEEHLHLLRDMMNRPTHKREPACRMRRVAGHVGFMWIFARTQGMRSKKSSISMTHLK